MNVVSQCYDLSQMTETNIPSLTWGCLDFLPLSAAFWCMYILADA